jgi:hypothetical protein
VFGTARQIVDAPAGSRGAITPRGLRPCQARPKWSLAKWESLKTLALIVIVPMNVWWPPLNHRSLNSGPVGCIVERGITDRASAGIVPIKLLVAEERTGQTAEYHRST